MLVIGPVAVAAFAAIYLSARHDGGGIWPVLFLPPLYAFGMLAGAVARTMFSSWLCAKWAIAGIIAWAVSLFVASGEALFWLVCVPALGSLAVTLPLDWLRRRSDDAYAG